MTERRERVAVIGVNVFDLLREEHREIDDLLVRLEQPPGAADFDMVGRKYLLDRLELVASRHEAAEEMAFWPDVRQRLNDGRELADRAVRAENDVKAVLDLVRVIDSEHDLALECARLHSLVRDHASFEEGVVFPQMHRHTGPVWRLLATSRFRAARSMAPTRPHPGGPDHPVGLLTAGAPAALIHHLRERLSRRRHHPAGSAGRGQPDAIAVISRDHREIAELLTEIAADPDPADAVVHEAIRQFSIHDSVERQYLYPAVRTRLGHADDPYSQLLSEHQEIARVAGELDRYRFHDDGRMSWLKELTTRLRTHMEQEEAAVLPALAARMTSEELVELGELMALARAHSPTRPHQILAGTGRGERLSRRLTAPLDRTRDLLFRFHERPGRSADRKG